MGETHTTVTRRFSFVESGWSVHWGDKRRATFSLGAGEIADNRLVSVGEQEARALVAAVERWLRELEEE